MRRFLLPIVLVLTACAEPPAPTPATTKAVPGNADAKAAQSEAKAKPKPKTKPQPKPREVAPTFDAQLAAIDRAIEGHTLVAERNGRSSSAFGRVAQLYLGRARLSGDYDDYAKAESFITRGFETGPEGFGPFMARARLNYTIHRLDRVDEDLAQANVLPAKTMRARRARELFAANLAFQRGQYDAAKAGMESVAQADPNLSTLSSLALYHWKAAEFDQAEALYERALEGHEGTDTEPLAWVHLQRGLMDLDRGRYDEALAHYRTGEALIAGYWLIDEHIAEILTLTGKTEQAKTLYASILERTNNPEFMDALAGIHLAAGETEQAEAWVAKATARFEQQLERFPEAAYGHALEHFIEFGDDPARTLHLAEQNFRLRPNATAMQLLAQAHLGAGQTTEALAKLDQALATPMRSADLHLTAVSVHTALGNERQAREHLQAAQAIDPTASAD